MPAIPGIGPKNAAILVVLPPPSAESFRHHQHLSSSTSEMFSEMLHEVGIMRTDIYCTSVYKEPLPPAGEAGLFQLYQPKKGVYSPTELFKLHITALEKEIDNIKPRVIIAAGGLALWALTQEMSVSKWRGSFLSFREIPLIPIFSPQEIMRQWSWRWYTIHDLRRVTRVLDSGVPEPDWLFHLQPSFSEALEYLNGIKADLDKHPLRISHDIETVANHIDCAALTVDGREAMCVPFMSKDSKEGYWTLEEEEALIRKHRAILEHENARVVGQNYAYDSQYIARYWGFLPRLAYDTQIAWHVLFPGERKSLDVLASLLCDYYVYWKDDLKQHRAHPEDETKLWRYNCVDAVNTFEIANKSETLLMKANLLHQFQERMAHARNVLRCMLRGIRIDHTYRNQLHMNLLNTQMEYEQQLEYIIPHEGKGSPWYRSPKKMQTLLYDELGLPPQRHKKTRSLTADDAALEKLASKEPLLRPIFQTLQEYRSVKVFVSTFLDMRLDLDQRARSSLNMAGPETFRLSSSKDVFGFGLNLQNIPAGTER